MNEFVAPGTAGDGWVAKDSLGHLLVIEVHSLETGIVTSLGERDAISATIHDIDDQTTYEDALIFPKVLIGSLKNRVGQKVLGTVGQGVAKPGQNPPYVLNDASGDPAAAQRALAYLQAYNTGQFAAPTAEATPAPAEPTAAGVDLSNPAVQAALAALAAQQK
jgi:hypothetical protein